MSSMNFMNTGKPQGLVKQDPGKRFGENLFVVRFL